MRYSSLRTFSFVAVALLLYGCGESSVPESVSHAFPKWENSIGMEFVELPAGTFPKGHVVKQKKGAITEPFAIGIYEVTQAQYQQVAGKTKGYFKGPTHPVEGVSWNDATEFCRLLSAYPAELEAGRSYRLPSEDEWEYACRAGTATSYFFGERSTDLGDFAWFGYNSTPDKSGQRPSHPVGEKKPNPWGLFDIQGNMSEWCTSETNPGRLYRGGSITDGPQSCTSWHIFEDIPSASYGFSYIGFRVCVNKKSASITPDSSSSAPQRVE
jgi:formylglycine-generating enzyme required for sulfatase activity